MASVLERTQRIARGYWLPIALVLVSLAAIAGTITGRLLKRSAAFVNKQGLIVCPVIAVEEKTLDIGEVWETSDFTWPIEVKNTSGGLVKVESHSTACACASPNGAVSIAPGETKALQFAFDLFNSCDASKDKERIKFSKDVHLTSKTTSGICDSVVELHGIIRRSINVSEKKLDLGNITSGEKSEDRVVWISEFETLKTIEYEVESDAIQVALRRVEPKKWKLTIAPSSYLLPKKYVTGIKLKPVAVTGESLPPMRINVEFDLLHDIQPVSKVVLLGPHSIGSTIEGRIEIRSMSGREFTIESLAVESGSEMQIIDAPNRKVLCSYSFPVFTKIIRGGNNQSTVRITGKDSQGKPFELRINVLYFGLKNNLAQEDQHI